MRVMDWTKESRSSGSLEVPRTSQEQLQLFDGGRSWAEKSSKTKGKTKLLMRVQKGQSL